MTIENSPVLEVENLEKHFSQQANALDTLLRRDRNPIQAVDGVSLTLEQGESAGVIGESGCGKTTLLKTLVGLHEPTGGQIYFKGNNMDEFDKSDWREFKRKVQIIFQDPYNSLDPKLKVREAIAEPLKVHNMGDIEDRVYESLEKVELNPPHQYIDQFPRNLSGGEKQRVSIARAIALEPELILADEPVSMLDVSTQASVLNLLSEIVNDLDACMLYISHDLSTVSYVCDEVNVMYLGRIVERAPTKQLLEDPHHPYSQALMDAIPIPDPHENRKMTELPGSPSDPIGLGEGCRFRDRCPERMDICDVTPKFVELSDGRQTACHLYYDHEEEHPIPQDKGTITSHD